MRRITTLIASVMILSISMNLNAQKKYSNKKIKSLKNTAINLVEQDKKNTQIMVDKVFSFSELGFQEFETSNYLTSILESNDFIIEKGASNVPTAWFATWSNGDGGPTIALGSDIDGIPNNDDTHTGTHYAMMMTCKMISHMLMMMSTILVMMIHVMITLRLIQDAPLHTILDT